MAITARQVRVSGLVQGVGFRWYTRERAGELGVVGWVKNLSNGDVEVLVEGEEAQVGELLAWLEHGPPSARVTATEATPCAPEGHERFRVLR
jgi:acylphosphatase